MVKKLLSKYEIALQSNSKEIVFSTIEIGLLITDITKSLYNKSEEIDKLIPLLKDLYNILKDIDKIEIQNDGGKFV